MEIKYGFWFSLPQGLAWVKGEDEARKGCPMKGGVRVAVRHPKFWGCGPSAQSSETKLGIWYSKRVMVARDTVGHLELLAQG